MLVKVRAGSSYLVSLLRTQNITRRRSINLYILEDTLHNHFPAPVHYYWWLGFRCRSLTTCWVKNRKIHAVTKPRCMCIIDIRPDDLIWVAHGSCIYGWTVYSCKRTWFPSDQHYTLNSSRVGTSLMDMFQRANVAGDALATAVLLTTSLHATVGYARLFSCIYLIVISVCSLRSMSLTYLCRQHNIKK
jgi:hypothetical protein